MRVINHNKKKKITLTSNAASARSCAALLCGVGFGVWVGGWEFKAEGLVLGSQGLVFSDVLCCVLFCFVFVVLFCVVLLCGVLRFWGLGFRV